jgi:hypothetical protein
MHNAPLGSTPGGAAPPKGAQRPWERKHGLFDSVIGGRRIFDRRVKRIVPALFLQQSSCEVFGIVVGTDCIGVQPAFGIPNPDYTLRAFAHSFQCLPSIDFTAAEPPAQRLTISLTSRSFLERTAVPRGAGASAAALFFARLLRVVLFACSS